MSEAHRFEPELPPGAAPAVEIVARLHAAGHAAYLVGGAVRDLLLGLSPGDFDVATAARPEEVAALFPGVLNVGASFGVQLVPLGDVRVEVATFRSEGAYADGRHPDEVVYTDSFEEDSRRRDFTVNALYLDPENRSVHDPWDGLGDLRARRLRAVGEPVRRFEEDGLRLLRAARLAAACGLTVEDGTRRALADRAGNIEAVAPERVGDELTRILTGPHPATALRLLLEAGLLRRILPEVADLVGVGQPPDHHPEGDVWTHVLQVMDHLESPSPALGWAALLHDVGKPATREAGERIRFPGHARVGSRMARRILERLRRAAALCERVERLVDEHGKFFDVRAMREATRRRFLRQPYFPELLALHRADRLGASGQLETWEFCRDELARLSASDLAPAPLLDGRDLLAAGVPAGPRIGALLEELETLQLEGEITDRETALAWLSRKR